MPDTRRDLEIEEDFAFANVMAHRRQTAGERLDLRRDLRIDGRGAEARDIEDAQQLSLAKSAPAP